ncbi:DUF551 domain-containing protein [Salmonella enterica subsp. enterica serovar Kottbus]|nr:DUF551 domain-containing protein [Salmonella enterica subsp. enterica serovar Kottbus]EHS5192746.1 DUF551 domain-containing protein [Salmonella enterica subsp. enterica serovar Kottbus]EHT1907142.1 DUF551 domain-containing protein [Salmonella enterica subsp. enterica serovar Kottbus]EIB9841060.1 DUF551 domain-containing protein [Salmonella enterica subsp. enterica serovar Kottbus]EID1757504.1 DUF551 domain-containing protein [Salmonella enterica subsp. enterica serovar Kottbus]
MTTITKERLTKILIETMALIKERSSRTGDSSGISTEVNAELFAEVTHIALASLEAKPVAWTDAEELRDLRTVGFCEMFAVEPVSKDADMYRFIPLYTDSPVSERERIRREHAEWSDLPELIEGMEVSVDVSTCDFDAGHRYFGTVTEVSELDTAKNGYILLVQDAKPNFDVNGNSPVIPDGWISCSERMPEDEQEVIVHNKLGYRYVSYFDEHSGLFFDMRGGNQMNCIEHIFVTHWMPVPAAPEPEGNNR